MLKPLDPQKSKYHNMYIEMADTVAKQSVAIRRKVGAVIIMPTGLISVGYNGTLAGFNNDCEDTKGITKPDVIHAEVNALNKLTRQGIATEGAILFVTTAPCINCAKSLASVGIREVYYRDVQSNTDGLNFLKQAGIPTFKYGE